MSSPQTNALPSSFSAALQAASALKLEADSPLLLIITVVGLALVPTAILALTSFIKISLVFNILKNALGAGQLPSAAITSLLALVLSVYVMGPVVESGYQSAWGQLSKGEKNKETQFATILAALGEAARPLQVFLTNNSGVKEKQLFHELYQQRLQRVNGDAQLGNQDQPTSERQANFVSLVPAFMLSELKQGFVLGFFIYLPFLVIDIVVANILVGLGLVMVSPNTITFPLKLLLFVGSDGWLLICRSLVLSYIV